MTVLAKRHGHVAILSISGILSILFGRFISAATAPIILLSTMLLATILYVILAPGPIKTLTIAAILVAGLVDLPRVVSFQSVTGGGIVTILLASAILLHIIMSDQISGIASFINIWGGIFVVWALFVTVFNSYLAVSSVQNILVYLITVTVIAVTTDQLHRGTMTISHIEMAVAISTFISICIFAATFIFDIYASPRPFALFAVTMVAWYSPKIRMGSKSATVTCIVLIACIGVSLSRTALAVALVVILCSLVHPRRLRSWIMLLIAAIGSVRLAYWVINSVEPLRERFFAGDVSMSFGGVGINSTGRTAMWGAALDSWREDFGTMLLGQGAGSVTEVIPLAVPSESHPHNDYLRILHDFGLIGLVFWVLFIVTLFIPAGLAWWRASSVDRDVAPFHLSAVLAIMALSMTMFTDNAVIYYFAMVPVAAAIGCSQYLRLSASEKYSDADRRESPAPTIRSAPYAHP